MNFGTDYAMTIDGRRVTAQADFPVVNPANEQVIGHAPDAARDDLDGAVAAARRAFPGWASTPIEARRDALHAMAEAILAHVDPLARLLTAEQGKPHLEAQEEVLGAAHWLKGAARLEAPVTVNEDSDERYSETRRVPLGVVGAIAPWNFPLVLAMFKVGPALLAGNTMVLKPSPFTPLATLKIGELVSGLLPPGVLNVVSGGDRLGPWITEHPDVDKVSFTGSTATGKRVMQSASATLKRLTLELGGNDAAIVLPDVDVEAVTEPLFWAAFRNNGQVCIATKRMYVHAEVYERLKQALVAYARSVTMGNGAEQGIRLGPVNNRPQYERVLDLIGDAKARGFRLLTGGEAPIGEPGYFIPATIIDNPPENSRIVQEEQFGPVLPLLQYQDVDEVVRRVNATPYGLGASIWAKDEERALALAQRLASGVVWINETQHLSPTAPFGGMKQSGLGLEGGVEGLLEYTCAQTVVRRRRPLIPTA